MNTEEKSKISKFTNIPLQSPDPILGLKNLFQADHSSDKVDLGVGVYGVNGKTWVPPPVEKAKRILGDRDVDHNYLGSNGNSDFCRLSGQMIYGEYWDENKIAIIQSLSGTGGLRIGAAFIAKFFPGRTVHVSNPTWGNHFGIFEAEGIATESYDYYDPSTLSLNFTGLIDALSNAEDGSIFIFHACAHNPTGVDPTEEQWKDIAQICLEKNLIPFFDAAYIGFASGDIAKDAFAIRLFTSMGIEFLLSQSFAKNFGLYGERIGTLSIVTANADADAVEHIKSQLARIVRVSYSNPPLFGSRIVSIVLGDEQLREEWFESLRHVGREIQKYRHALHDALIERGTPGSWGHILNQIGMFTYTGLSKNRVQALMNEHHIYMLSSGRINILGLNDNNVGYVADAIDSVVRNIAE